MSPGRRSVYAVIVVALASGACEPKSSTASSEPPAATDPPPPATPEPTTTTEASATEPAPNATDNDAASAQATVKGSLDKDIIRRVVREHLQEIRSCYEAGLARDANLRGRVPVQFVISPTGVIAAAIAEQTDVADKAVVDCIVAAVRTWKFPPPVGGGNVVVTYPFLLESS